MSIAPKDAVYIHGEMIKGVGGDPKREAYVSVVKSISTGETEIKIIDDPEVPIYITKPQYRLNTAKKELEEKSKLDMYRCKVRDIPVTIFNAVKNPGRWSTAPNYIQPKKMLSNPYVYGADIDFGVHLKRAYNKVNGGKSPLSYNVGFLDIETDVNGSNQIILITFMNGDGRTYVGILREFYLEHTVEEAENFWTKKVEPSLMKKLNEKGLKVYEKLGGLKIEFKILDKEVDLLRWVFSKIHEHKPDFIGIWNIAYDVPFIMKRCQFRGIDPRNLFCSPDVPFRYRVCDFKEDQGKKGDHIVDRWSWLHCTSYSLWIDYMCLYGRLRKAKPREPSYKLDAIGGKEIGSGKLEFGEGESHSTMQRFHQVEYTIYNVVDVLIMLIMEHKNHDIRNMMMLIGVSTLDCFAHQSIQLKNHFYDYLDSKGCVPASIGNRIDDSWDFLIKNKGGAVLDPSRADIAVASIVESVFKLRSSRFTCDIDVSSAQAWATR